MAIQQLPSSHRVQWADKFLAIPSLIITTAIASTLLAANVMHWQSSEAVATWILSDPTSVAIYVQITSYVLGGAQVQVFCSIVRCTFLSWIQNREFSLDTLQWISAASTHRMSFGLPWVLSWSLIVPLLLSIMPAAIWSGSITPVIGVKTISQATPIATFQSQNASDVFLPTDGIGGPNQVVNSKGLFSFDPAALRGPILNSATDASAIKRDSAYHPKLDKSTYLYQGRSYGAGASVGLSDEGVNGTLWYRYYEPSFDTNINCIHNASSDLEVDLVASAPMIMLSTSGKAPTNESMQGAWYTGWLMHDFFGWGTTYSQAKSSNNSIFLQLWATANRSDDPWFFADFDTIQCQIDFVPKLFEVFVNNTNKVIQVTPSNDTSLAWPDYAEDVLSSGVSSWLWKFSMIETCGGGCSLGRSIRVNTDQLISSTQQNNNDTILQGVEDHIGSLVDNTLVALASGRIMIMNTTASVEALTGNAAATFGDRVYIITIFLFNFLLCVLYIFEAVRTWFWQDMPALDLTEIGSIFIGSLKGGIVLAGGSLEMLDQYKDSNDDDDTTEKDVHADSIRLRVRNGRSKYPTLSVANSVDQYSQKLLPSIPKAWDS